MNNLKNDLCPYCGKGLGEETVSIDHVIPKQIGGSDKFTILSCKSCNVELGKIEQRAIGTSNIRNCIADVGTNGFKIKNRRKGIVLPLHKGVGLAFKSPMKMYYDPINREKIFQFLKPPDKSFFERGSGTFIIPASELEESDDEILSLTSLASKIILGTCAWLWGDGFSMTGQAAELRNRMRNKKIDDILTLDSSEKHLELSDEPGKDALDNHPHHSILIGKMENKIVGLINLFGYYESMTLIGDYDANFKNWLNDSGIVVISKTTENGITKMTWEEYEKFKMNKLA